jgi:hypothetical protein
MKSAFSLPINRLRLIVMGYLVRGPMGGMAWHHLQYVMGLAAMGHEVVFLEDSGDNEWACYDPARGVMGPDPTYGLKFAEDALTRVGLSDQWAYHDAIGCKWYGPAVDRIFEFSKTADLVLNLSGENPLRPWIATIPIRVYIDTDPVFTQIRHLTDDARLQRAREHTTFFSFGENFGKQGSNIPNDGLLWRPTRQPVVLDAWPVTSGPPAGSFTTVMQWDNTLQNTPREYDGQSYGRKSASFRPYADLPCLTDEMLEIALGGRNVPRDELSNKGWLLRNPLEVASNPWTYQAYIQRSKGEFSVAKEGYVVSKSGWFSERSAAYLASGRPVVTQETGFTDWLDTGAGVLAFNNIKEAANCLEYVSCNYRHHCKAAREIAEQYFDSQKVLQKLLDDIFMVNR